MALRALLGRAAQACIVLSACAYLTTPTAAERCAAAKIEPTRSNSDEVFEEARAYAAAADYAAARALYAWILMRAPEHHDARLAAARLEAWERCYPEAERRYRALLRDDPGDVDALDGLFDVYLWSDRPGAAQRVLDEGLTLEPRAAGLWLRRARLSAGLGDRTRALTELQYAQTLSPDDDDVKAFREVLYHGQLRVGVRLDDFPETYPNMSTGYLQVLQFWHTWEFGYDAVFSARRGGATNTSQLDGRHFVGVTHHFPRGQAAGGGIGLGGPIVSVPSYELKAFGLSPLVARVTGYLGYSFWHYRGGRDLHILNPALTFELTDTLSLDLRVWSTLMFLPTPKETFSTVRYAWLNAAGVRAMWRPGHDLMAGVGYSYGPQLDQSQRDYNLLTTRSHTVALFADWRIERHFGVQPALHFESRHSDGRSALGIPGAEVALYARWE